MMENVEACSYTMKILALYLPQFHTFPENDRWWGKGYTEWTAVRKARPMFPGHDQPKVPLGQNYYDLVKNGVQTLTWQAKLMKQYGVYGLCMYHYWFNGKLLLEKPMEILRDHPEIDMRYTICWANEPWARTWDGKPGNVLMPQTYGGEEEVRQHFQYLLPFFKDQRYIKIDGKPMVHLYKSANIPELEKRMTIFQKFAMDSGFPGIYWVSAITAAGADERRSLFDHYYYFEPGYTLRQDLPKPDRLRYLMATEARTIYNTFAFTGKKTVERRINAGLIWDRIEKRKPDSMISPGTFPSWDNTPRKHEKGTVFFHATPERFGRDVSIVTKKYPEHEFLYINAWNEWGEGAYLEPDEKTRYAYLEELKK